jgi:penicillin-insensitive murein endopeptidase
MKLTLVVALVLMAVTALAEERAKSTCYGTTDRGRMENAWKLPASGDNSVAYSSIGVATGRTHVHSAVYEVVVDSFRTVQKRYPEKVFVYGETGWKNGGRFRPHKTHQNGLSVDFFVPVVDATGRSVPLPAGPLNKFGYDIEFTPLGQFENNQIDFEAMAAHLVALQESADKNGIKIGRVIFDNDLQIRLFKTSRGKELQSLLNFSKKKPWVRHDEHYHVDFAVPCEDHR